MSEQQPQNAGPHVKEYMDSQNPTAYNTGAIESISAMPKDEKGLPIPSETAFNLSQVILEGDGEAKARSKEMQRYSDVVGQYAEGASVLQGNSTALGIGVNKNAEEINKDNVRLSESLARDGLYSKGSTVKPKNGGMLTGTHPFNSRFDRSPASIRLSEKEIRDKAIVNAKKSII